MFFHVSAHQALILAALTIAGVVLAAAAARLVVWVTARVWPPRASPTPGLRAD